MDTSRAQFTNAIKSYLTTHSSMVNLYSMATRYVYTLVVGHSEGIKRQDLTEPQIQFVRLVEELASEYMAMSEMHPLEAIEMAYNHIKSQGVERVVNWTGILKLISGDNLDYFTTLQKFTPPSSYLVDTNETHHFNHSKPKHNRL